MGISQPVPDCELAGVAEYDKHVLPARVRVDSILDASGILGYLSYGPVHERGQVVVQHAAVGLSAARCVAAGDPALGNLAKGF